MRLAAVLAFTATFGACVQPQQSQNSVPDITQGDSLRGIARVVGSEPGTWVVLVPPNARAVSVMGLQAELLRSVNGAEVVIFGTPSGPYFDVQRFVVRTADGLPVWDGVLTRRDGAFSIALTEGGTAPLVNPATDLQAAAGERIWITQTQPGFGYTWGRIR